MSAHLTFLCAKLKACLVKSCFTPIVDMWFVHVHYEELDIMLALSAKSERLCSLADSEWSPSLGPALPFMIHNNVCYAKK